MSIVMVCGSKGGSGKSTVAISLAAELLKRERRVLLVDADPLGTARTWGNVANTNGFAAPTIVGMGSDMHRAGQLDRLSVNFDVVIIDCPPSKPDVQRSAMAVSDMALLPSGPSAHDVWAMGESIEMIDAAKRSRPTLQAYAVITRKVPNTTIGQGARESLENAGIRVLEPELCFRVAYQEAPAAGLGVTDYAPKSIAADEVRALTGEVIRLVRIRRKPTT